MCKPSKHFILGWTRKWDLDIYDLKTALKEAYKINKVGKNKYEAYTKYKAKGKSRKIIFLLNKEYKEIFIITGAEGK